VFCLLVRVALYAPSGFQFDVLTNLWQLLDFDALRREPLQSLYWIHMQPPLLNTLLAMALALPDNYGELVLQFLFLTASFAMIVVVYIFLRTFGYAAVPAGCLSALFGVLPQVLLYENWFFYPHLEAALLLIATYYAAIFISDRRSSAFAGFSACLVTLALLRSVYHLGWVAVTLAIVWAAGSFHRKIIWRNLLTGVVALLIVTGFYTKNYFQFGIFSPSSWQGLNLASAILPISPGTNASDPRARNDFLARVARGEFSAASTLISNSMLLPNPMLGSKPIAWGDWASTAKDCDPGNPGPMVLCSIRKLDGDDFNFNHRAIIGYSRQLQDDALKGLDLYFPVYLRSILSSLVTFFGTPSWENVYMPRAAYTSYHQWWNALVLYEPARATSPERAQQTGWRKALSRIAAASLVHICLVIAAIAIVFGRATSEVGRILSNRATRGDWIFPGLVTILFLTLPHLTNASETNRMRYSIEPILFLALAYGGRAAVRTLNSSIANRRSLNRSDRVC